MKKIVYVIIGLMSLVLLVNISAINIDSTVKLENSGEIVEFNPIY